LKNVTLVETCKNVSKILFVKVPTFRLKLQPSSGESDKEFVEKARSYTMQIGKSELIMFCPLGLNYQDFMNVLWNLASALWLLETWKKTTQT